MVTQEQELGATGRCQGIASKGLHIELQTGQGCHGQGKVREFFKKSRKIFDIVKVSEKSGNSVFPVYSSEVFLKILKYIFFWKR